MKISIITISYNVEKEIERTMRSVLNQTFKDLEYIVVDGKSKDNTVAIAKSIAAEYPDRAVRIISEPDKGIYDAMNKGIKMASGEWVNMMNAGDVFVDENVLENIFKEQIPDDIAFLYSDLYKKTSFGRCFKVNMYCTENERHLVHQSCIYRRKLHQEYGYYVVTPKIIISDYLFFLQVPLEVMKKMDTVIAIYEGNGVSEQGNWCELQILCANVVFRHGKFSKLYLDFIKWKLKHLVPRKIREYIRLRQYEINQ